ncbi:MAG: hypothetical protein ABEI96_07735 [Haloarculaceae archaeon]
MEPNPYRAALFALYQFSLLLGIVMFPFAVAARQVGVTLPVHRVVDRLGNAYERASGQPA